MSLLESYDKNKKKHLGKVVVYEDDEKVLIKEVTAAGDVGAFTGRAGDYIDKRFAGPFHPEFAQLKKLLKKQVDGDIIKRMYSDDRTPFAEQEFVDVDWKYEYDEYVKQDNSKFKNTSETEMQNIDTDYEYDPDEEVYENEKFMNIYLNKDKDKWKTIIDYDYKTERALKSDKSRFKNTSGGMQNVKMNIKYDKIIDKTEENKKYVNDTNGWKSIYDSKK